MDGASLRDVVFFPSIMMNLDEVMHRYNLTIPWKYSTCSCRTMSHSVLCCLVESLPGSHMAGPPGFTILCHVKSLSELILHDVRLCVHDAHNGHLPTFPLFACFSLSQPRNNTGCHRSDPCCRFFTCFFSCFCLENPNSNRSISASGHCKGPPEVIYSNTLYQSMLTYAQTFAEGW